MTEYRADGQDARYPEFDPALPDLPGVEIRYDPEYNAVHGWQAWRGGVCIAKSPWKKLTWKTAKAAIEEGQASESEHLR